MAFVSADHENRQERNEVYIPNRPFPLNNGPIIKLYSAIE